MPSRSSRSLHTLAARVTALVVVATLAVGVLAAVLLLPVVRSAIADQSRDLLREQLSIALADDAASLDQAVEQAELLKISYALVTPDGQVSGTASVWVTPQLAADLLTEGSVSSLEPRAGGAIIIEGRTFTEGGLLFAMQQPELADATLSVIWRAFGVLAIGLITAVVGGVLLARKITAELVHAAGAAGRMAAGERGVPVPPSTTVEVRALSEALSGLDRALARSEGAQREFLLSISHELRTPLTAIRGYGEALADGVVDPAAAGAVLQAEAQRLDKFVEDLLALARLEADDFPIDLSVISLADVAAQTVEAWQGLANSLEVGLEVTGNLTVEVESDLMRVRQLVDGLMENALRVAPSGSAIRLVIADSPARIEVHDAGPGLSPEDLDRIFERGVLRERYRHSRPVGTGLGLSIADRLSQRLGARLTASSGPTGTSFSVAWGGGTGTANASEG